jgi:hypothetical protein
MVSPDEVVGKRELEIKISKNTHAKLPEIC